MTTNPSNARRTLVVVAGSGRSGTSTIAGALKILGLRVPPPEVPGNRTNPRGFFEPRWVVDFQTKLLRGAGVALTDSRPAAFAKTDRTAADPQVRANVSQWLGGHFDASDDIVVKDPRSSWFLPLWRAAAEDSGAEIGYLTMLRHPAEVVGSKDKYYKAVGAGETLRHAQTTRVASWLNVALFTEHATRGARRTFVVYEDLLADWRDVIARIGAELDLDVVREVAPEAAAEVDEFIDPGLRRVRTEWSDIDCPDAVRELAQETWDLLVVLAGSGGVDEDAQARLDEIRERYVVLQADAEALAQSAAEAARRDGVREGRRKARQQQNAEQRQDAEVRSTPARSSGLRGRIAGLLGSDR